MGGVLSPFSTNSIGMRGVAEFELEKPEGFKRVALIGDSFTFGLDKPGPKIWGRLLANRLTPHEVLNFGVSGYGTDQSCLSLSERALDYGPDVVVWGIFIYDPQRSALRFTYFAKSWFEVEGDGIELHGVPVPTPEEVLARHVRGVPALYAQRYARSLLASAVPESSAQAEDSLLELNRAIMDYGKELVEDAGAELLVVLIPTSDWPTDEPTPVERDISAWAAAVDCPMIDLREVFSDRVPEHPTGVDFVHYVPDYHFSIEGHRVVADVVARELRDRGWIPEQTASSGQ